MQPLFLRHARTGALFEIISLDRAAGKITLKGPTGGVFTEDYSVARMKELGYELVRNSREVP